MTLPPPVAGTRLDVDGLACWTAGSGPPLLLVHSVNAAASAAEVRPLFEDATSTHTVYAPDLPGFGASPRGPQDYTPRLMTDAVLAVAKAIRARHGARHGDQSLPALAVSLGCEFLARAASEQPGWFERLALVSPTGLNGTQLRRGAPGTTRQVPVMLPLLSVPLWSQALFDGLTKPGVVRYFLERTWGGKVIDEAMWQYAVLTAREPGARFAPLAFLSGRLFSADIGRVYEALALPVWASHGTRGDFTDYRAKVHFEGRPNWRFDVYEGGALPYFEQRTAFGARWRAFLAGG
jgi:pimeloyl-ACP methyl ester carboxylesterase